MGNIDKRPLAAVICEAKHRKLYRKRLREAGRIIVKERKPFTVGDQKLVTLQVEFDGQGTADQDVLGDLLESILNEAHRKSLH